MAKTLGYPNQLCRESPVQSITLQGLLLKISEWAGLPASETLARMENGGEFAGLQIVRQLMVMSPRSLSAKDLAIIKRVMAKAHGREA